MITINDLIGLKAPAQNLPPHPNPNYPPSVYYRYLALLLKKLNGKLAVELGTCGGGASLTMAMHNPQATIVSIDINKLPQVNWIENSYTNFKFKLGDSTALAAGIVAEYGNPDLLFIDTDHTYVQTLKEFNTWIPFMKPGSVICFDDLNRDTYDGGVKKFYEELKGNKTEFGALKEMHISGSSTDGGFGALLV